MTQTKIFISYSLRTACCQYRNYRNLGYTEASVSSSKASYYPIECILSIVKCLSSWSFCIYPYFESSEGRSEDFVSWTFVRSSSNMIKLMPCFSHYQRPLFLLNRRLKRGCRYAIFISIKLTYPFQNHSTSHCPVTLNLKNLLTNVR